jgi:hypothetical protein
MIAASACAGTPHGESAELRETSVIGSEGNRSSLALKDSLHALVNGDYVAIDVAADALADIDDPVQASLEHDARLMIVKLFRDIDAYDLVVFNCVVVARGHHDHFLPRKSLEESQRSVDLVDVGVSSHSISKYIRASTH